MHRLPRGAVELRARRRAAELRPLSHRHRARLGRHGHRLPRVGSAARARDRDQGRAPRLRRRKGPRAADPRGPGARAAVASERLPRLRRRHRRRRSLGRDGADRRRLAARVGRAIASALLDVLLGAARGIAAAHDAGLVHRDIKPENVLVTRDGRAIVTDFGLARGEDAIDPNASTLSTDPHLTATGAIAGTPAYIAPEQLTGDPIDARVDQFAYAVMAWELLTGTKPFPIIFALRVDAVRAGVTPPPTLPKHLAAALAKAMAVVAARSVRDDARADRGDRAPGAKRPRRGEPQRSRGPIYASLAARRDDRRRDHRVAVAEAHEHVAATDHRAEADRCRRRRRRSHLPTRQSRPSSSRRRMPASRSRSQPPPVQASRCRRRARSRRQSSRRRRPADDADPPPDASRPRRSKTQPDRAEPQRSRSSKSHSHSGSRAPRCRDRDDGCVLLHPVRRRASRQGSATRPSSIGARSRTSRHETGHFMGDDIDSNIITIQGARGVVSRDAGGRGAQLRRARARRRLDGACAPIARSPTSTASPAVRRCR